MNNIRFTIKAARERAGISLKDMAYFLHVKVDRYAKFESYEKSMTYNQAMYFRTLVRIPSDNIQFCNPMDSVEIRNMEGHTDQLQIVYGSNEKNQPTVNELAFVLKCE